MKTYILDSFNRFMRFSEQLDVKTILSNKEWVVFNDSGDKEVYLFQEDGTLMISLNGRVTLSTWRYLAANRSVLISVRDDNYMMKPFFVDENVFVLQLDGTNEFSFMIDAANKINFKPQSLQELKQYFIEKLLVAVENKDKSIVLKKEKIREKKWNEKYCKEVMKSKQFSKVKRKNNLCLFSLVLFFFLCIILLFGNSLIYIMSSLIGFFLIIIMAARLPISPNAYLDKVKYRYVVEGESIENYL